MTTQPKPGGENRRLASYLRRTGLRERPLILFACVIQRPHEQPPRGTSRSYLIRVRNSEVCIHIRPMLSREEARYGGWQLCMLQLGPIITSREA